MRNAARTLAIGFGALLVGMGSVLAQQVGDPAKGRQYALTYCATCHSVIALPPGASPSSPNRTGLSISFEEVAATPGMTELALNVFFRSPHPSMPNLIVQPADVRDLVAYILSLKR